jgi:hypothetical protein
MTMPPVRSALLALPLLAATLVSCVEPAPERVIVPPPQPLPASSNYADASAAVAANCVLLQNIRETRVRNDSTIDFYLRGGKVLRNTLPNRCPNLGVERAFTYSTSINQLCNVDIITVINQGGGNRLGASCGLGKFTALPTPPKG